VPEPLKEFFISYTGVDVVWARWIAAVLQAGGYSCVYQERDFPAGFSFVDQIDKAMATTRRTIAILSPEYIESNWCRHEWQTALKRHIERDPGALVPVRIRDCTPPDAIETIVYIDLTGKPDEAEAREMLLARLAGRPPDVAAIYPGKPAAAPPAEAAAARYPGALPPHWNVPHRQNPYFTGRNDLLAQISAAFQSGGSVAISQPQAITGLGGIGKTSTAVEYCYRNHDRYDVVWWIRSEMPETLRADYASLASEMSLPGLSETDQGANIALARKWLETHGGWLLVFDNAEKADDLKPYLPAAGKGHILITSRARDWGREVHRLSANRLEVNLAAAFLISRTEGRDERSARDIAEDLDGLPLALEHAAAYIISSGITLAEWRDLYRSQRLRMFDPKIARAPEDHPESVVVTWNMAFERIRETPFAADILNTLAFFAPDDIPMDLVRPCVESEDPLVLPAALKALTAHSLIERPGEDINVHRLVQAATRDRMDEAERRRMVEQAVEIALAACPEGNIQYDVAIWPAYGRLLPHLQAVAEQADSLNLGGDNVSGLWWRIGDYCRFRVADFATAKHAYERSLAIDEAIYGPDQPQIALSTNRLARALQDHGDLQGAKAAYERALRIYETTYGNDDTGVAAIINNVGLVLQDQGELQGAKVAYERALRIAESIHGLHHPNVATVVCNLGLVLRNQGDLQEAKAAFERALRIDETTYGPEHPQVARDVNHLGSVLHDLGDSAGARTAYERALKIQTHYFGPDHPNTRMVERALRSLDRQPQLPQWVYSVDAWLRRLFSGGKKR
jgi:tetratricopeptide (TPR) repeat protein